MVNGNGAGRPKLILDWELISKLAEIQCTEDEIAFICKCSAQTLRNHAVRTQNSTFDDFLESHRAGGRASIRRAQFDKALGREGELLRDDKGNLVTDDKGRPQWKVLPIASDTTMLIWLGKQHLGQVDRQEHTGEGGKPIAFDVNVILKKLETLAGVPDGK